MAASFIRRATTRRRDESATNAVREETAAEARVKLTRFIVVYYADLKQIHFSDVSDS